MNEDGSGRAKVLQNAILELLAVSPGGRWAAVGEMWGDNPGAHVFAVPTGGRNPVPPCSTCCVPEWTPDGKTLAVVNYPMRGTKTYVYPILLSSGLLGAAVRGFQDLVQTVSTKGRRVFNGSVILGPTPELTATAREEVHRNLYRVPLQ